VEQRGLDYYDRLVDGLVQRNIAPVVTLYHWDLPQALEDAGGWPVRDTALRFAEYAEQVHARLSDRVPEWITINEPWCAAFLGYAAGVHAPGRREPDMAYAATHHLMLGHALAAPQLGGAALALNLTPIVAIDEQWAPAAAVIDAIRNRIWLDPLTNGRYPADLVEIIPILADPGLVRDGDLAAIAGSLSWLGVNYYTPERVGPRTESLGAGQEPDAYPGAPTHGFHPRGALTEMGWEVDPSSLAALLRSLHEQQPGLPLVVTENGAAYPDQTRRPNGSVDDQDRIDYLREHIHVLDQLRSDGVDIRGYFAWTLLDNFEWAEGYTKKFGLVEVEPGTLRRIPKRSFDWYADLIVSRRSAG
jgi:beta-glucosidase